MLDFGTKMPSGNNDKQREDIEDLFSTVKEEKSPVQEKIIKTGEPVSLGDKLPAAEEHDIRRVPMPGSKAQPQISLLNRKKINETILNDKLEVARIIRAAREKNNMSYADVEEVTKIRVYFLQALENGEFDQLPQPVFVLAYLRKLCELYNIPAEDEELIVKPWMDIQCEIPENLPGSVYADSENENRNMIRRIEIGLFTGGAIAVAALVIFGIILLVSHFSGQDNIKPAFDESKLLELQPAPVLSVPAVQ